MTTLLFDSRHTHYHVLSFVSQLISLHLNHLNRLLQIVDNLVQLNGPVDQ